MLIQTGDEIGLLGSRRHFLASAAKLCLLASLGAAACSKSIGPGTSPTPTTSSATLGLDDRLEALLALYEGHGKNVASGLRGPATEAEIASATGQLGFEIPADVRQLWSWRNGWVDSPDGDPFWFRDNWLTGTHEIQFLRETMEYYNYTSEVDIDRCVPIAEFNGAVLAVATGEQSLLPGHEFPVIEFFEGVDAHYHSVATMIETAIAWVSAPGYNAENYWVPPDELAIWQRLNPDLRFWN